MPAFLRKKSVLVPLALVVAAVVAFAAYGWYTRSTPVDYARGGSDFAVVPSQTPQPGRTAEAGSTATPAASAPAGSPQPSASGSTAPVLPRTDASQPAVTSSRAPVVRAGVVVPRTGTYGLKVEGSEKVDFGPLSFCSQDLPETARLVVSKAQGESATSYNFDLPYFQEEGKHDERHLYRYTKDAVFLDYEIATLTCQGVRQSSDTDFSPPQLRVQLPLRVGDVWTSSGGDAERTENSSSRIARTEALTVAGERVPTWVIETTTSFSGDETGSRTQTWWWAPSWAMPVKWSERISGGRSGASYSEDVTVTVTSRP